MAENRFLDKDGLSILVTKIKTELDNVDDVLLFKGIVDDAEVLQGSAASISQISYISSKKVFAGYNKPSYYNNWGTRAKYCNEAGTPIGGKIFIDVDTYKVYTWNGGDLREVLGKDLATINKVLDSLPADILTDISATTDAESITLSFAAAGKGSKGDYGAANAKEIVLNPATPNDAGLMSAADKKKIDKAATLDEQGKVPSSQLPSFVDDVQEFQGLVENVELTDTPPVVLSVIIGIYYDVSRKVFITKVRNGETEVYTSKMFPSFVDKPTSPTPLSGKIYVDLSTNKTYRWSGSNLVEISASLALGETENTAFAGDRGVALEGEVADLKESVKTKADKDFVGNNLNSISEDISKIKASAIKNIRPSYDATHVNLSQEKIEGAAVNISIDTATSSKAGAMSAADKKKLDNFIDSEGTRNRNETARVSAESDRAAAETARAKAETERAKAETARADAESKRETDFSAKVKEVDTAVTNAKTATSEAEKVDATITDANVFEVTGRDGVKKSLELVGQAEAATIKTELAGKLDKVSVVQELGEAEDKVVSQKAVKDAIESVNANLPSLVKEEGAYLCNEKGEVFARFVNGKFEAVGLEQHINKLEDIKNVAGGSAGQFLQKKEDGSWSGTNIDFPQSISSLNSLTDVDINPVEGSLLQYKGGKWVNAEISTDGMVTTDSRSNHPMYGKHFFAFGDSHTEAPGFGLWQMLCELTGAIYHTLLRKKAPDGTYHFFSATTSATDYSSLIDEEDTGIEVNCDSFNWAQYAHAAYTYAQSKGFNIDYILVENCHFGKWNFYNDDGSVKENVPIVLLNKTKVYSQIFENAMAVMNFVSKDANVAKVVDELGFDSIDSSFDLRYGTASQELVFSFSNGNTLSADCVAKIHFGDDTSKTISTTLSSGMTLTDCVDAINQWAFNEYSTWVNPTKGTQGNTKILLNYSSEVGGDSSTIANFEITNSANLVMQQPTISVKTTSWIHEYGLKDTSGLKKSSSWLRSGGSVNWSLPNAMLGAMQYMGKHSPKTKFVFLGIWNNEMKEEYKYADDSVNPYDLIKSPSYKGGQISKKSIKDIAELFGWQYIDVDKLCGITPFNVTPTFNNYNNVHMKRDGYRFSAECIAKYIK